MAVTLSPGSIVPYQSLARTLLRSDRLSECKTVLEDAAAHKLDSSALHALAYDLAFIAHDTAAMQEHLRAGASRQDGYLVVSEAARAAFATGDIESARTLFASAARAARGNDVVGSLTAEQALDDTLIGDVDRARDELQAAIAASRGPDTTWIASLAASFLKRTPQAVEFAKAFQGLQPPAPDIVNAQVAILHAAIAINSRDGGSALAALAGATPFEGASSPWLPYLRGLAYAATGNHAQAIRQFRGLIDRTGNEPTNLAHTLARLQLARAARDSGDTAEARQRYADFVTVLSSAKPTHPLLILSAREAAALPPSSPAPSSR